MVQKRELKRISLAQITQWVNVVGVCRIVHTGMGASDDGIDFGTQLKHSIGWIFLSPHKVVTWPSIPAVPTSISIFPARRHISEILDRASILSNALMTIVIELKSVNGSENTLATQGLINPRKEGENDSIIIAATVAFGWPMCSFLKRNWRWRLVTSMVSISTRSMLSSKGSELKTFRSSHPIPPAPKRRIFMFWLDLNSATKLSTN